VCSLFKNCAVSKILYIIKKGNVLSMQLPLLFYRQNLRKSHSHSQLVSLTQGLPRKRFVFHGNGK